LKTRLALALALLAAAAAALAPTASAAPLQFSFGFADDRFGDNLFTHQNASVRAKWLNRTAQTGARYVRINVYWSLVARSQPANPASPADPACDWGEIDRAVKSADAAGLQVILLPLNAPGWAEGGDRPAGTDLRTGTWKPAPNALQQFARAMASRYSGSFKESLLDQPLPRVSFFEAWNEPNLPNYLNPQWKGKKPVSPNVYRNMLNAVYDGVKSVHGSNKVITAGTSPFGDDPGGRRVRPIYFWRQVLCLNNKLKRSCTQKARFDIFGHNAINSPGDGPRKAASHRDDATPSDMKDLGKVVRAAERAGTAPGPKHPLWSTETWYESFPERKNAFSLKAHAKVMQEAMYVLWKQGVENVIWLQIRDTPYSPKDGSMRTFQTGVYLANEKPKPAVAALRTPFVVEQQGRKPKATFWGIAPAGGGGTATIEQKVGGRWRQVTQIGGLTAGATFVKRARIPGANAKRAVFRARYGQRASAPWKMKLKRKPRSR
jgi:hypothetical protein